MNRLTILAAAALIACSPAVLAKPAKAPATASSASSARKQLDQLADQYYEASARFEPIGATENGDNRFDDQLGMSITPKNRAAFVKQLEGFDARLHKVQRAQLGEKDQLNYDILAYELQAELKAFQFPSHLMPITQMDSVPLLLANYAGGQGSQPLTTVKQYRAYLHRLQQLPAWIDQAMANMRTGMKSGVVLPRALVLSALPQLQKLVTPTPEANLFYTPIKNLPANFSAADKAALTRSYRQFIGAKLQPSLQRLATFMQDEYLPAASTAAGLSALPNGAAWYAERVAFHTTTKLTPEQVHAKGLEEVARIQAQYAVLGPKMGYDGPAAGLPTWVEAQAKYHPFTSEQQILDVYAKLNDTLKQKLPSLFTLMPKAPLDLRLEPELTRDTASDHYTAPAADGSRPGVFWSVVTDPKAYGSTGMVTLFLHEGQPGHHFHIALMQELNLPKFRKFGGNNAFTEGWALYAETLGREMGLFDKPEDYFGHLNDEMLRAVRLVVDTGLHTKGWTREQAIQYMRDTLGYSEPVARGQVERYMAWPGQAVSYKIGALKIAELRARATAALGPKFSLPKFHQIVLEDGTLPLSLLEAKVDRWIAEAK